MTGSTCPSPSRGGIMLQLSVMRSSSAGGTGTLPQRVRLIRVRAEVPNTTFSRQYARQEQRCRGLLCRPDVDRQRGTIPGCHDTRVLTCLARSSRRRGEAEQGSIVVPEPRVGGGQIIGVRRRVIRKRPWFGDGSAMVAWRSSPLIGRFGPFPIYVAFVEDLPPMPPTPQGGFPRCAR